LPVDFTKEAIYKFATLHHVKNDLAENLLPMHHAIDLKNKLAA
jgi:hypothetical protein